MYSPRTLLISAIALVACCGTGTGTVNAACEKPNFSWSEIQNDFEADLVFVSDPVTRQYVPDVHCRIAKIYEDVWDTIHDARPGSTDLRDICPGVFRKKRQDLHDYFKQTHKEMIEENRIPVHTAQAAYNANKTTETAREFCYQYARYITKQNQVAQEICLSHINNLHCELTGYKCTGKETKAPHPSILSESFESGKESSGVVVDEASSSPGLPSVEAPVPRKCSVPHNSVVSPVIARLCRFKDAPAPGFSSTYKNAGALGKKAANAAGKSKQVAKPAKPNAVAKPKAAAKKKKLFLLETEAHVQANVATASDARWHGIENSLTDRQFVTNTMQEMILKCLEF